VGARLHLPTRGSLVRNRRVTVALLQPQRGFVSNAVSNAKKDEHSAANFGGQKVLRFDEIWASEIGGEQVIWA
jgi:hypothetical protein